jgi:asparagine N-glycosylation enzyme membrane subunit Stt3
MINSDPPPTQDNTATHLVASGPIGAALLAGVATAIVLAIWVGFYFFVFAPRTVP